MLIRDDTLPCSASTSSRAALALAHSKPLPTHSGTQLPHQASCLPPSCAPVALQALAALRAQGKRLLFVTNNSSKSRQQYVSKFQALGIEAHPQEVSALHSMSCCMHHLQVHCPLPDKSLCTPRHVPHG
jgi:hypothetical protein